MSKPLPLVRQLQADAIDPKIPVSKLLRTAKAIAIKLGQKDALKWINGELEGYMSVLMKDLPHYRIIGGQPKAFNPVRGWQTIQFPDGETAKRFSTVPIGQPIGSLEEELGKRNGDQTITFGYPPEMAKQLRNAINFDVDVTVFLSHGRIWGVIDAVRNLVLNWSLELEQAGILGEDMTFTAKEKEEAGNVTQHFIIQNVGVLGNVSDRAKVENRQTATATLNVADVERFVGQATAVLDPLPKEVRSQLAEILQELKKESQSKQPKQGRLRELLTSARTIAEGAAGNLAASGIITAISTLLSR